MTSSTRKTRTACSNFSPEILFFIFNDIFDNIDGAGFHLVENVADVHSDETGDKKLDAGKCAHEDDERGVSGDGGVQNPHH